MSAAEDRDDSRMIEWNIPLAEVNLASAKEKKHPRRFVELVHQWQARRPRSASRVATAAALLRVPLRVDELGERFELLRKLAPYECGAAPLERARKLIRQDHAGRRPKVLDIFAGGGAIPLEAANLGCEAHAVELNPVAHIIELATCVYPQKFGKRLGDLVQRWGQRVIERATLELADLYSPVRLKGRKSAQLLAFSGGAEGTDGAVVFEPIAYLWTRTVPCVDRDCGATVPLVKQTWLCRKPDRVVAMKIVRDRSTKTVRFEIVKAKSAEELGFDPADHSDRGDAECPFCGATVDAEKVKAYGIAGKIGKQLMAVAGLVEGEKGRAYLPADAVAMPADAEIKRRLSEFADEWPGPADLGLAPEFTGGSCVPYGLDRFYKLFTDRQAVSLLVLSRAIRESHAAIEAEVRDAELAKAVVTFLALTLDKLVGYCSSVNIWDPDDQLAKHAFGKQALPMIWDFAEINPLADLAGSFPMNLKAEVEAATGLARVPEPTICIRASSTELPYPDDTFDAVVTDPPYYDNISYADLSDFFFVWLKRTIGDLHPDHLSGEQTPKRQEATVTPYRHGGSEKQAQEHFDRIMTKCFEEAGRVLRPGAPLVVVYAHKTVAGWATLVDALRKARCRLTEAWPLATESKNKWGSGKKAAMLITSIFLSARKRDRDVICNDYDENVLPEVARVIEERVDTLWEAGLQGADLVVAVIGAALGPFTKYVTVRRVNGQEVTTAEFLEEAQRAALDAILVKILRNAGNDRSVSVSGIDPISRLYVVARLQFGEAAAEYDSFKNLAIGALPRGTELEGMRGALMQGRRALLSKKGSKVTLRSFEERGEETDLGLPVEGTPAPLIDVLHRLLWLQRNRAAEVLDFLRASGADMNAVRLVAQALGGRALRSEPRPGAQKDERDAEQRAVDTFLASMHDLTRSAGPMFEGNGRKKTAPGDRKK